MGILSTSQPVCVSTCSLYQYQKEQSLSRTRLLLTGLRQVVDNRPFRYYFGFCLSQWSFCAWENLGLWGPVSCDCKHAGYVQQQCRGSVLFRASCHESWFVLTVLDSVSGFIALVLALAFLNVFCCFVFLLLCSLVLEDFSACFWPWIKWMWNLCSVKTPVASAVLWYNLRP